MPKTCPYHNKFQPCPDCQAKNMGEFAWQGTYKGSAAPAIEPTPLPALPPAAHNHGTEPPFQLRCGVGEGIYVLNNRADVENIYTDSLLGCAQVILRNARATFTCHIVTSASFPIIFLRSALEKFRQKYGPVTECHVISAADNPKLGNEIDVGLALLLELNINYNRITDSGGCAVNINDGEVQEVPSDWNTGCPWVAGWLTAPDLIDLRITGPNSIGSPSFGDYFEGCQACRNLFS